jgi:hypothetical protein
MDDSQELLNRLDAIMAKMRASSLAELVEMPIRVGLQS